MTRRQPPSRNGAALSSSAVTGPERRRSEGGQARRQDAGEERVEALGVAVSVNAGAALVLSARELDAYAAETAGQS